jgi:hypothetical protein
MRSGERCQQCHIGKMKTRTTFTRGSSRVRYLVCTSCATTGKECLRLDDLGRPIYLPFAMDSKTVNSNALGLPYHSSINGTTLKRDPNAN